MFFKMYRRFFSGEVLHTSEVSISNGGATFRLKLKRERSTGDLFAILSVSRLGSSKHEYLDTDNIAQLAEAVRAIQTVLEEAKKEAWTSTVT